MNKPFKIAATVVVLAMLVFAGWWLYEQRSPSHEHILVKKTDPAGQVYYTCPMHPQVRQDQPGNCPICGMKLARREDQPAGAAMSGERKPLYWYDPMRPDQHFDAPGKSPFMDMDLVPKYADGDAMAGDSTIVRIDPRMAQNLGMRTAEVRAGTFWQRVDAVGSVAIDERRIVALTARAAGWVERLNVRAVGDPVRRGQVVAGVYAPELLAAQEELALAKKLDDATLIDAATTRLKLLDASSRGRPQRQTAVVAPQSGVVTELLVREGDALAPGMPLMKVADLSHVWIVAEIPEAQAAWVAVGKPAEARLRGLPGKVFEGRVEYLYPLLDARTRTLRARLLFDNAGGDLKPGMYAQVTVFGGAKRAATLVPSEAVIRTGTRNVVLVAEDAGRYRPVEVVLGPERDDEIVVVGGLEPGQRVVVSGQFLIDSEASLLGAYRRMEHGSDMGQPPAAQMRNMGSEAGPGVYETHPADGGRP
jgi:Cu(I)/Ag(I) efflux system membrane fusion protein